MSLVEEIKNGRTLLLDGATGTELYNRGLQFGKETILAHEDNQEIVQEIVFEYLDKGSDIVLTNTFGASRISLERYNLGERVSEINLSAAMQLNMTNVKFLGGSIGPTTGEYNYGMDGFGYNAEQLYEVFKEQISALKFGRVNFIALETFMCYEEAEQALRASKELGMETVVSFAFNYEDNNNRFATLYGTDINKLVGLKDADIVGFNCGSLDLEQSLELTKRIKDATDKPIWAKPNAGPPSQPDKIVPPSAFAEYGERMIEAGANLVGGCCMTTPAHIEALRKVVDKYTR